MFNSENDEEKCCFLWYPFNFVFFVSEFLRYKFLYDFSFALKHIRILQRSGPNFPTGTWFVLYLYSCKYFNMQNID